MDQHSVGHREFGARSPRLALPSNARTTLPLVPPNPAKGSYPEGLGLVNRSPRLAVTGKARAPLLPTQSSPVGETYSKGVHKNSTVARRRIEFREHKGHAGHDFNEEEEDDIVIYDDSGIKPRCDPQIYHQQPEIMDDHRNLAIIEAVRRAGLDRTRPIVPPLCSSGDVTGPIHAIATLVADEVDGAHLCPEMDAHVSLDDTHDSLEWNQARVDEYTAQVDAHIDDLIAAEADSALPPREDSEALGLRAARWALLAANCEVGSLANRRVPEPTEKWCLEFISRPPPPDRVSQKVTSEKGPDGITKKSFTRSKTSHMAVRAMAVAREIWRDDKRTRCFFATVSRGNRPWYGAVARCLRKLEKLEKRHASDSRVLRDLVGYFSALKEDYVEDSTGKDEHRHLTDAPAHAPAASLAEQVSRLFSSAKIAADLRDRGCCSVCAIERLIREKLPPNYQDLVARLPGSGAKVLKADADRHNKEMHTLNGNIVLDLNLPYTDQWEAVMNQAVELSQATSFPETSRQSETRLLRLERSFDSTSTSQAEMRVVTLPDDAGTLHSVLGLIGSVSERDEGSPDQSADIDPSPNGDDLSVEAADSSPTSLDQVLSPESSGRPTIARWIHRLLSRRIQQPPGPGRDGPLTSERPIEIDHNVRFSEPTYLGVRCEMLHTASAGLLTPTAEGTTIAGEYMAGIEPRGSILNDRNARNVLIPLAGLPRLALAADTMEVPGVDLTPLALRAVLYDMQFSVDLTHPTGQTWAPPKRSVPKDGWVPSPNNEWGFRYVTVSARYLDQNVIANGLRLDVGDGDYWDLSSPSTVLISLYAPKLGGDTAVAAWILTHLDYPLASSWERWNIFQVDNSVGYVFLKNAGLVRVPNSARNIVFVTTDADPYVWNDVQRASVPDYRGNCPVLTPRPFDRILWRMIESMRSGDFSVSRALRLTFSRIGASGFPWDRVNRLAALLTVRFPPKPEISTAGAERRVRNMPRALADLYGIPSGTSLPWFGHNATVNALDQPPLSWQHACAYPVIVTGNWSASAELLVGMGWRSVVYPNSQSTVIPLANTLRLSRLIRRGFEAWKDSCGLRDELIYMPPTSPWWEFQRAYMHGYGQTPPLSDLVSDALDLDIQLRWDNSLARYRTTSGRRLGAGAYATTDDICAPSQPSTEYTYRIVYEESWCTGHQTATNPQPSYAAGSYIRYLNHIGGEGIRYEKWHSHSQFDKAVFGRLLSTVDCEIYNLAGWSRLHYTTPEILLTVGWGAPQAVRDWTSRSPVTAVVSNTQWEERCGNVVTAAFMRLVKDNRLASVVPAQQSLMPQDFCPVIRSATGSVDAMSDRDSGTGLTTPQAPSPTLGQSSHHLDEPPAEHPAGDGQNP